MSAHGGATIPRGAKRFIAALLFFVVLALAQEYNSKIGKIVPNDLTTRDEVRLTSDPKLVGNVYQVVRVVDGDTLNVRFEGKEEKVRLIGINTPETVDPRRPVECFGKEASNHMKELADAKNVFLETDTSQGERDKFGRLLAYVYLEDGQMVNRKMVAEGYAYEYTYLRPYKYQEDFKKAQNLARATKVGLWADNACGLKNIQK